MSKCASFVAAFVVCAVFTLWQSQFAPAQLTTTSIVGTVTDSSGSKVPGVALTATEIATDTATAVTSDASGSYSITPLKIGSYTITFEKTGFQRVVQKNVTVDIGDVVTDGRWLRRTCCRPGLANAVAGCEYLRMLGV
jgi:hypothetical protein